MAGVRGVREGLQDNLSRAFPDRLTLCQKARMSNARVDKGWQERGLAGYPIEAILSSLKHYGVEVDEAGYHDLAKTQFPLGIAEDWLAQWKGTGQFSRFPVAAADELWTRWEKDRLSPRATAEALAALVNALQRLVDGAPDAPVGKAFDAVEALKAKLPQKDGALVPAFSEEIAHLLGEGLQAFNHMAEALAREGHVDDALQFAGVEEAVFPEREGVVKATIQIAGGEKEKGMAELRRLASDTARLAPKRMAAVDAMLTLDAFDEGARAAEGLWASTEAAQDFHAALEAAERLVYALEKKKAHAELEALRPKLEALVEKHQRAHPDH
jgi:hypothetical protein